MNAPKKWQPVPGGRGVPVIRPMQPAPRSDVPPDDLLCTWVFKVTSRTAGSNHTGHWELKYIHQGCPKHSTLPRVA